MAQHIPTKSIRFVVFLTAALGLGLVSQPAFAKKKRSSTIQMTGIKSFDKIFKKARTTDKRLKSAEKSLKKSKKALRQTLKLGKKATYTDGLKELKTRANGKLRVVMVGGVPSLKASEAVPTEIQASIDAINTLTKSMPSTIRDLKKVARSSTQMYNQSRKFPTNIQREMRSKGLDGLWAIVVKSPKITKKTYRNLKVIGGMPKRATKVNTELVQISSALVKTFK